MKGQEEVRFHLRGVLINPSHGGQETKAITRKKWLTMQNTYFLKIVSYFWPQMEIFIWKWNIAFRGCPSEL